MDPEPCIIRPDETHALPDGTSRIQSSLLRPGDCERRLLRSERGAESSDDVKMQNEHTPDSDACIHSVEMQVANVGETEWLDDVGVGSHDAGEAFPDISFATQGQPADYAYQFPSENPSNNADFTHEADEPSASNRSEDEVGQKNPICTRCWTMAALICACWYWC